MEENTMDMMKPQDNDAEAGRGTDNVLAHMSLGEIVIPRAIQDDPEVQEMLQVIFDKLGADINEFTVGHEANKINPETGYPEFGFFKKFKKIASVALPIAASFIPGIGPLAAAGLGAAGGALGGGGLKGALIGGALSGIGAGLNGGATSALKGTALGGLEKSISGALSPIGTAIKGGVSSLGSGVSGALSDFGNATGLSDIYNTASGAVSNAAGGIGEQISNAYNGSVLQDAFKSGGDVLKSAGLTTSPDAVGQGVGAAGGGGQSPYSAATPSILDADIGNYKPNAPLSYGSDAINTGGATADFAQSLGATGEVGANNILAGETLMPRLTGTNYISPITSALLGQYTNSKAENQLLTQQRNNQALLAPYQNFKFNPSDLTQDPGYQFNLEQGNRARDRQQLAKGGYFSGEALKEAQDFGQGLAENTYGNAFTRALQTQGAGLQAAGALANVNDNIGNIRSGSTVNSGNVFSGALGSVLGGDSFTNSGALQGATGFDYLTDKQKRDLRIKLGLAA